MLPQGPEPIGLFSIWNLSGRFTSYMPKTPVPLDGAPQKVTVIVPPGAACDGSAITLMPDLATGKGKLKAMKKATQSLCCNTTNPNFWHLPASFLSHSSCQGLPDLQGRRKERL